MAPSFHLFCSHCLLLFLLLPVHGKSSTIFPSDRDAVLLLHRDLAGQRSPSLPDPCTSAGIFCERRRVTRIVFRSERLGGTISQAISGLPELKELTLPHNQLSGQIPAPIVNCRKLEVLNLRGNRLSGQIPPALSSLTRLRILDLSSNRLSGDLNFLQNLPTLEKLSLADNLFSGVIPPSLRSFRNLSGNSMLKGPVPATDQVDYLWEGLRENNEAPNRYIFAESKIQTTLALPPKGPIFQRAPHMADPSPGPLPRSHSSPPAAKKKRKREKKVMEWMIGFAVGAFAGGLSGMLSSMLFKVLKLLIRGNGEDSGLTIFSPLINKAEDLAFLEKEDGLASMELVGRGGCGEVYKAPLPGSQGRSIAIKKIIQPPMGAAELREEQSKDMSNKMRQIKSEIQILGEVRHRNLLPLLAHIPRPDCHYLVYEFMKNGSLQDALREGEGERGLDWPSRHRIAVGIASGLEYLHMNHTHRIIHRDLKPANVLLDDNMEARIADFGLAKAVPSAHTHITTSKVAGTVGYIAPEYHQTLKFTDRCDIYSFGVVLGVLVVGRLPSDEFFQTTSEVSMVKWMRNVMASGDAKDAIDPKLVGNGYEEQMILVLKIACFCTLDNPKDRPNSKDVRCMLTQIKHCDT